MTPQQRDAMRQAIDTMKAAKRGAVDEKWFDQSIEACERSLEQQPVNEHQDWCASLTQVLTSMPPQPAPCNCKPEQQPAKRLATREEKIVRPGVYEVPVEQQPAERLELIGHADLAINNIHIFNGYGEEVPEGRTPIYAGYTRPRPAAQWVGLTGHEAVEIWNQVNGDAIGGADRFARAIEAKLKEKNNV